MERHFKLYIFSCLFIIFSLFFTSRSFAVSPPNQSESPQCDPSQGYCLLAPIPLNGAGNGVTTQVSDWTTYIPGVVELTIGIAGALAVLMIVVGGMKYVMSASALAKADGRLYIQNALTGLLLAMSAWLILNTINPKLVNFNLSLEPLPQQQAIDTTAAPTSPANNGGNTTTGGGNVTGTPSGTSWPLSSIQPTDATVRSMLGQYNISVNNPDCSYVGQTNCTSLDGLGNSIITGLETLATNCHCAITITGGTEYWLHSDDTAHVPGGNVVDLSLNTSASNSVTSFLRSNATPTNQSGCSIGTERYIYNGALYVNEQIAGNTPHWHVCF